MTKQYKVAGHIFCIEIPADVPESVIGENYRPFETESGGDNLFTVRFCGVFDVRGAKIALPVPKDPYETRVEVYEDPEGTVFEMAPNWKSPICARLLAGKDNIGHLYIIDKRSVRFAVDNAMMLMYAIATTPYNTLEMHASVIKREGFAYMFLGVSGTGKSTHSRLWLENIPGSRLLNDDNPVIRLDENGLPRVYGSPWSGKTPCYINDSAPLGGIVSLEQWPANEIVRQDLPFAFADIYSSCSGLKFRQDDDDALFNTCASVAEGTGCWHLKCLPDAAAAQICCSTITPKASMSSSPAGTIEVDNAILLGEVGRILEEGNDVVLMTKGGSMLPTIRGSKDSVRLRRCAHYDVGDVVLAHLPGGNYVLHRIAAMDADAVTLAGDGNLRGTESCKVQDILGRAVAVVLPSGRETKVRKSSFWRHCPTLLKRIHLHFYRKLFA